MANVDAGSSEQQKIQSTSLSFPQQFGMATRAISTRTVHSESIPYVESATMRSDTGAPSSTRPETDHPHELDIDEGITRPLSFNPLLSLSSPEEKRPITAMSSSEVITPMPPAIVSSRRNTLDHPDITTRSLPHVAYSNLGVPPPTRESRRLSSSGPEPTLDRRSSTAMMRPATGTDIDWIVPVEKASEPYHEKTVSERLEPTLLNAIAEKTKYATKARLTGYALNAAIGLQVILGSLTTALSVVTKGSQTATMTAVLGGFSTIVASYLARMRGSNEPELSITRVKDLEQFIRECEAFKLDNGHATGNNFSRELERFRERFEELLGNANGERKLSTPV